MISIHALLAESDAIVLWIAKQGRDFYPRSPCGERHLPGKIIKKEQNFYPRSPCGERRVHYDNYNLHCVISIHALLAESDCFFCVKLLLQLIFLSTLSLRRATAPNRRPCPHSRNFYPRSPCGERLPLKSESLTTYLISIHALLAESDSARPGTRQRGAISIHALLAESDVKFSVSGSVISISIHALLAESDRLWACLVGFVF